MKSEKSEFEASILLKPKKTTVDFILKFSNQLDYIVTEENFLIEINLN